MTKFRTVISSKLGGMKAFFFSQLPNKLERLDQIYLNFATPSAVIIFNDRST